MRGSGVQSPKSKVQSLKANAIGAHLKVLWSPLRHFAERGLSSPQQREVQEPLHDSPTPWNILNLLRTGKSALRNRDFGLWTLDFGLFLGFALCLLLLHSGCSPRNAQAAPPPAPSWSWATYPPVEKMRLAVLPCRVLPKTSLTINASLSGLLRLYVDRPQTNLPAGFVWAEFEPKILAAESDALADAKQKLHEREQLTYQLELPKQQIKLAKDLEEARRQLVLLELLATNIVIAPSLLDLTGLKERGLKPESLQRARDEIKLMEENYRYISATNLLVLGIDLEAQRLELQRRQLEFDRHQVQGRLKMPFAGQLNPTLQLAEGVNEYPVSAGQELAVARDLSVIQLRVPLTDPSWSTLRSEDLSAVLNLPDGSKLAASFAFKKLERFQMREDVIYYFQFSTNECSAAMRLVGADVSCELWLALAQPAHVVPKLALVLHQPASFQNRRWSEGVAQLSPGAQILVEGQTDLAVVVPETNSGSPERGSAPHPTSLSRQSPDAPQP